MQEYECICFCPDSKQPHKVTEMRKSCRSSDIFTVAVGWNLNGLRVAAPFYSPELASNANAQNTSQ